MSDDNEKPKKKAPRRKPLWLVVPVGQRTVERDDGVPETETIYTVEQFFSVTDLRKNLEARELDQTNSKGILLFRADATPVETKMKAQVVIKFGASSDDEEEEGVV
jgi:hypothetical protein